MDTGQHFYHSPHWQSRHALPLTAVLLLVDCCWRLLLVGTPQVRVHHSVLLSIVRCWMPRVRFAWIQLMTFLG